MPVATPVSVKSVAADEFAVSGELSFATAALAHAAGCALLQCGAAPEIRVDCSAIDGADSAGLAVLLDWLAIASGRGVSLRFISLPLPLQQLARIGGVSELLGVNATSP
ncbi:MAG: STAS domain-containing protein [Gammaproteobacteria bacterium]|nr:STAS domain-containing protein [Gammaproteobacteria bacterium]